MVDGFYNSFEQFSKDANTLLMYSKYLHLNMSDLLNTEYKISCEIKTLCFLKDNVDRTHVNNDTVLAGIHTVNEIMNSLKQSLEINTSIYNDTTVTVRYGDNTQDFAVGACSTVVMYRIESWLTDGMRIRCRSPEKIQSSGVYIRIITNVDMTACCQECRHACRNRGMKHINENKDQNHMIYIQRAQQYFCLPQ